MLEVRYVVDLAVHNNPAVVGSVVGTDLLQREFGIPLRTRGRLTRARLPLGRPDGLRQRGS